MNAPVVVVARVLLALMFILAGFSKFAGLEGTAGYIASKGLPMPAVLAFLTAALEVVGGLALAVGFKARWVALGLAGGIRMNAILLHVARIQRKAFENEGNQWHFVLRGQRDIHGIDGVRVGGAIVWRYANPQQQHFAADVARRIDHGLEIGFRITDGQAAQRLVKSMWPRRPRICPAPPQRAQGKGTPASSPAPRQAAQAS